jgi:hypothetical protein
LNRIVCKEDKKEGKERLASNLLLEAIHDQQRETHQSAGLSLFHYEFHNGALCLL